MRVEREMRQQRWAIECSPCRAVSCSVCMYCVMCAKHLSGTLRCVRNSSTRLKRNIRRTSLSKRLVPSVCPATTLVVRTEPLLMVDFLLPPLGFLRLSATTRAASRGVPTTLVCCTASHREDLASTYGQRAV